MKNRFVLLLMLTVVLSKGVYSQTFDEYLKKKQQEKNIDGKGQEFDRYYQQKQAEFQKYLAEKWHEFDVFSGESLYEKPKPEIIPAFKPDPERKPVKIIPEIPKKEKEISISGNDNENPDVKIPVHEDGQEKESRIPDEDNEYNLPERNLQIAFEYFNTDIYLNKEIFSAPVAPDNFSGKAFAKWWKSACNSNYSNLISQLLDNKQRLILNDYGYLKLIEKTSEEIAGTKNQQILVQWFLLVSSGYDVRLAYTRNQISLFIPVKQQLYSKDFFTINGVNYYVFSNLDVNKVKSYKKSGPGKKVLDFDLYQPMKLNDAVKSRGTAFIYNLKTYYFELNYNPNWIEFLKNYPQGDLEIYFDASVSNEFKSSILKNLNPVVSEMETRDALNFLLRHVQEGFDYKTDPEQFGHEKFFFPEEILYYPFADCEDRAVYFAWLVRHLLHLEVIGLQYEGHVATAVLIPGDQHGDYLVYKGKKYTIADPTYMGAPVGLTMPAYFDASPEIILLNNK